MSTLPPDLFTNGLAEFAALFRDGAITAEQTTQYCLDRIEALNPQLNAFEFIDSKGALSAAGEIDRQLASGVDTGPLMGVPVAIKDIMVVDGMPTTNGSNSDTELLSGSEGTVVRQLREAGCIIIGKTRTVEFALGATGINSSRGTAWNPWDKTRHRIPGGSSSGSAVATATGMCGFALGTDTGGSVRIPACFNGIFGHKTTVGLWPTDGVFPLSPTLDSIGPLCRTAADAGIIHQVITGEATSDIPTLKNKVIGIPDDYFFDDLDTEVQHLFDLAKTRLKDEGVIFQSISLPEAKEREILFPLIVPAELLSTLTTDLFKRDRNNMDSVTAERAAAGLDVTAVEYLGAQKRLLTIQSAVATRLSGLDAWITPTCPFLPMTLSSLSDPEQHARSLLASRNTQPGNLFGSCGVTLPIGQLGSVLPVGLQVMGHADQDATLLSMAVVIEDLIGRHALPVSV